MKTPVIIAGISTGYFRAKTTEKRDAAILEILEIEEFTGKDTEVRAILEAETLRRHVEAQGREARKIARVEAKENLPLTGGAETATDHVVSMPKGRYVLTVAQNNTDVDPQFFAALQTYCSRMGARLLVARMTYNKNGFQQAQDAEGSLYYDPKVVPFLVEGQIDFGGIAFCAQANVLPTAKNPLAGFEAITARGVDAVIPASKISLKCTAALKGQRGKVLYSTGAITKRNYILRKAGAVAASEHNIGALFIDSTVSPAVARQLERMGGSDGFYDECAYYTAAGMVSRSGAEALQFGDIHAEKLENVNREKLFDQIDRFAPTNVILHDVMDFSSRNHHNVKDCAFMFAQEVAGQTVANDIATVADVIATLVQHSLGTVHVIESNHDLAINTWLKNADFKEDPVNALTYLRCMTALYTHIAEGNSTPFNMLKFACSDIGNRDVSDVVFHETDESFILAGVEMGCHGHTGTNGSRGSPAQFRALGVAMNTGHTHTPSITGGCYTAGVAGSLEMGYNIGASSWQLANVVTWPNGQRQVIFM